MGNDKKSNRPSGSASIDQSDWLYWAVALLASEYGWALYDIYYGVYLDELIFLVQKINHRKLIEYRMQLAIVQNPHVKDPKHLWDILTSQDKDFVTEPKEFDPVGFELLKSQLRGNPRFVVKS